MLERTLILIKPDAIQRGLMGEIASRFEAKGLKIAGCKMMQLDNAILDAHYVHLTDKPFYPRLQEFMSATPVIAMCLEGFEAVDAVRELCGVTNSRKAAPGTIRGDLGMSMQCNLVHASDSTESAVDEVARFFQPNELYSYSGALDTVVYADDER
ncbi:MAG: nucleoside-diphosphate kinase [Candidatus Latescibacteria bacterium]|nr:nucleoside-diphosphate kinase [Candidatus Latescibacterota bacterium]